MSSARIRQFAAVLLIGILLFAPAAARAVADNGTIFEYEQGLDVSAITESGGKLVMYVDDDTEGESVSLFDVRDARSLNLTVVDLQGNYGRYFGVRRDGNFTGSSVYIQKPEVSLDVVLDHDPETSVEGQTVYSISPLRFVLAAPYVGMYLPDATVRIELIDPTGAKITSVGDRDLTNHVLYSQKTSIDAVNISSLAPGAYTARAWWESPAGFVDTAEPSNAVRFTIVPSNARVIEDRGTVFAYEESVDVSVVTQSGGRLVMYAADDPEQNTVHSIPVSDAANLDLIGAKLEGHYGRYYGALRNDTVTSRYVYIRNPAVSLDVQLGSEPFSSIAGTSVPANIPIRFQIDAPEVGLYLPDATVKIELTTPDGAKLTTAGGRDLTGHALNDPTTVTKVLDISSLEPGAYSARAIWERPVGFADYAQDSEMVVFNVAPSPIRTVSSGDTIFIYEKSVNVSAIVGSGGKLVRYTDDVPGHAVLYVIDVPDATDFDLSYVVLHGNDGKFFGVEKDGKKTEKYLFIREPAVSLNVARGSDPSFSLADGVVSRDTKVQFIFDAPDVGPVLRTATVRVELITPTGVTISRIGDQSLRGHLLDSARTYIPNIDISTLGTGKYGARAVWESPEGFAASAKGSEWVNFTVSLRDLGIYSNKEIFTRSNPIVVTVSGDPDRDYYLYIRKVDDSTTGYPSLLPEQTGVTIRNSPFTGAADPAATAIANNERARASETAALIATDADGRRAVNFATGAATRPGTYTIRVADPACASNFREVNVRVDTGMATIEVEGGSTFFLGDQLRLSGTCTDNVSIYLFVTGPGLGDPNGVALDNATAPASRGRYVVRGVMSNGTWTYLWNTSALIETGTPESGAYTVYATSTATDPAGHSVDSAHLNGVTSASTPLCLRMPSLNASVNPGQILHGDSVLVSGNATGHLDTVCLWIIGEDTRVFNESAVKADGTFAYLINGTETAHFPAGQYSVVVQHPMFDGTFNVSLAPAEGKPYLIRNASGTLIDLGSLSASEALKVLKEALDSPTCDDIYVERSFTVRTAENEAWIRINAIGDRTVGDHVSVSGTTNLTAGSTLLYAVTPVSVVPPGDAGFGGVSSATVVMAGTENNTWSFDVDSAAFPAGQYRVTVESPDHAVNGSTIFNLRTVDGNALSLMQGWNFISVPKALSAGNNTAAIFSGVNTSGHSVLRYDAAKGAWAAMRAEDELRPLEGIWIYSAEKKDLRFSFSTDPTALPPECTLSRGWNAVGFSDVRPATVRDCLLSLGEKWATLIGFDAVEQKPEDSIIRGGSGTHSDSGLMYPGHGYWLYMSEPGTLCAISA